MRALLLVIALTAACGPVQAAPFLVRSAGAATALAINPAGVAADGEFKGGWTYQLFWTRRGTERRGVQILGILQVVNCRTRVERALATAQYTAAGALVRRTGPDAGWTTSLKGSNTDYILGAMCGEPDGGWTRVKAADVFGAYRAAWSR